VGALAGRTVLVTGASRGIGRAIALRAAQDGANVVVAAKTARPHRVLEGTIYTVADEVEASGGQALPVAVDVRQEEAIAEAVQMAVGEFGGIDVLVNNASALRLTNTADTPMRRFDLMFGVNVRGTFAASQACLPYLRESDNPHILNISPPLVMDAGWFAPHVAYTMSKYGMSMCVLGMAREFAPWGIAVNALWPATTIATAAIANVVGGEAMMRRSRFPEIMAHAAHAIVTRDATTCTGNFFLDEDVLREAGVTDLARYAVDDSQPLQPDLYVGEPWSAPPSQD
jgi:citronellol/citronellal dehydrogenase